MTDPVHPHPNDLLAFQAGEASAVEDRGLTEHLGVCAACSGYLALLTDTASTLADWPEEEPPSDGLERVLASVRGTAPSTTLQNDWLRPALLSLLAVLAGSLVIYLAGAQLLALPVAAQLPSFGPAKALSGFGLAALALFGFGSLVTLALAPMLILESQWRERQLAAR